MENQSPVLELKNDVDDGKTTTTTNTQDIINERNIIPPQPCMNCINMAKNFLYLEGLLKSNGRACRGCLSAIKFLTYLNKNIAIVFSNLNYPQYYVAQDKRQNSNRKRNFNYNRKQGTSTNIVNNNNNINTNNTSRNLPRNASTARNIHKNYTNYAYGNDVNRTERTSTKTNETKVPERSFSRSKHNVTKPTFSSMQKSSVKLTTTTAAKTVSSKNLNPDTNKFRKPSEKKVAQKKTSTTNKIPKLIQSRHDEGKDYSTSFL